MSVAVARLRELSVGVFSHFSCLPAPSFVRIHKKHDSLESTIAYSIQSKWKQIDSSRNDFLVMDQEYSIRLRDKLEAPQLCNSSFVTITSTGSGFPYATEFGATVLWDIEQGCFRLVFTEYALPNCALSESETKKASAAIPGTFVHVFCSKTSRKIKTIKLPNESSKNRSAIHGKLFGPKHSSVPFSSCRFCPGNPNKVVYLAECVGNSEDIHPSDSVSCICIYYRAGSNSFHSSLQNRTKL